MWDQGPSPEPQVTSQPATTGGEQTGDDTAPQTSSTQYTASGAIPPVAPTAAPIGPSASEMAFDDHRKEDPKAKDEPKPDAETSAPPVADKPKTLGQLLKKDNKTIDQVKAASSWELESIAGQLLAAKGVDSPTKSQKDDTVFKLSEAIKGSSWESFEAPVDGQILKAEDGVNERLGNIFFEKKVFSPDELQTDRLKMNEDEQRKLHGGYESGVTGMVLAASFINTHSRSEGDFSHAYGDEAWDGFIKAEAFLDSIPKGQFIDQLTVETLMQVNKLIHAPDLGMKAKMLRTIAMIGRGGKWDHGGELRDGRQFARPENYSGPELDNIKEAGVHVTQMTHHEDGGGKAMLEYPKPEEVRPGLERIIGELKTDVAAPNADPIGAASKFQRHFVALHPFGDSNGRTSRILMNRILAEFDLPPAILADQNRDVSLSPDEWRTEVAKGCARSKAFLGGYDRRVESKDEYTSKMGIQAIPESPDKPVILGGKPFDLGKDGLLYDPTGRPWIVENNEVIPLAQLEHFVMSRRVFQAGKDQGTEMLQKTTAQTRALYDAVSANPDAGKDIVVRSDAHARKADAQYKLAPEPEVAKMLTDMTDVSAMDPQKMFQIGSGTGNGTAVSATLSKYAQVDLEFWYVERGLREGGHKDLVEQVRAHRANLFQLAKAELAKHVDASRVTKDNPEGFHFKYEKMMYDTSPLRFGSFEEAQHELGDKTMTVWRGDYSFARVIGMAPNNDIRQPDAKAIADERADNRQLTNLYDDLVKLEGSAVGRQYICTTSDLALLTGSFASQVKGQTVNVSHLPVFVKNHLLAWIDPEVASGAKPDPKAHEEKRKTAVERGDSVVPGETKGKEIKDAMGIPGTILTLSIVDKDAGKIEVTAARKAFEIELDKEALLPGIYALGGPSFESEQEVHGLEKVRPWDIKSAHKADELKEEFPAHKPEGEQAGDAGAAPSHE